MTGSRPHLARLLLPLAAALLSLLPAASPCEYRAIDPRHTMCSFRPRQCPGKNMLRTGGLTCQDKEIILDTHNMLRQKVSMGQVRNQPAALNMRALMWDEELAVVAQRWADQCMPGHDRARDVVRFRVGQNVAATWTYEVDEGDTPDFPTQVEAWFNEVNQHGFAKGSVDPFRFSKATGHYTQMVWAETYLVGCGYAYYKDPSLGYTKIYVCNYGPGGNVVGGTMYKLGFPGQQFCVNDGLHPSQVYQGLCDRDAVSQPGPCGNTFMHTPSPPVSNSISNGHSMMPPPPPPTHHHNMVMPAPHPMMPSGEYLDHEDHDLMGPSDFLVKGIHEPIMGLMKIFNPWKIINRITG
ncbi:venom allergen 5-like [Eriocheir sinensis]|uniref:venom allergen 5-like n=1 Tax=Eriocheir sinensis TaxID=95602 RepID=UPI0021C8F26E|nr:venom allergen 5-like [Eriocheir sinensis]